MFSRPRTQASRKSATGGVMVPKRDQVLDRERVGGNFRIVSSGPSMASGGIDGVDPGAVGQAGVDHRRGLVDPPADPRDDLVDDAPQVALVDEGGVGRVEPAVALDVDLVGAVDHDFGDRRVAQVRLERPVAEDVVGDLLRDARAVRRRHRRFVALQHRLQRLHDLLLQFPLAPVRIVELRSERFQQCFVDAALQRGRTGLHGEPRGAARRAVRRVGAFASRSWDSRSDRLIDPPLTA